MSRATPILQPCLFMAGICLLAVGRICLPAANLEVDPTRTNVFSRLADAGAFLSFGGTLAMVGLAAVFCALLPSILAATFRRRARF